MAGLGGLVSPAEAAPTAAIIDNGTIQLGINAEGHLNTYEGSTPSSGGTFPTGLRYMPTGAESTAPGCLCEGWGVADATSGVTGWANAAQGGAHNLTSLAFDVTASTARSVTRAGDTFEVTHDYRPSPDTANLYEVAVTIKNISTEATDVRYRRVMDWDVEPTAFSEFSTINPGNAEDLVFDSNDGFASSDPLAGPSDLGSTGAFTDAGPADHGALFDFAFGTLAAGATTSFITYYGAAGTEAEALVALGEVGAEAYSFGQPSTEGGPTEGTPNTFIFAFGNVGGDPIVGCGEDGIDALAPTGIASGLVHDSVEPVVEGVDPALAGTVHDLNCTVLVPIEDQIDAVITPAPTAARATAVSSVLGMLL